MYDRVAPSRLSRGAPKCLTLEQLRRHLLIRGERRLRRAWAARSFELEHLEHLAERRGERHDALVQLGLRDVDLVAAAAPHVSPQDELARRAGAIRDLDRDRRDGV